MVVVVVYGRRPASTKRMFADFKGDDVKMVGGMAGSI